VTNHLAVPTLTGILRVMIILKIQIVMVETGEKKNLNLLEIVVMTDRGIVREIVGTG